MVKNIVGDCEVGTLLFGDKFTEQFKTVESVKKSSETIGKPRLPTTRNTQDHEQESALTNSGQGYSEELNSKGPPKKNYRSAAHISSFL